MKKDFKNDNRTSENFQLKEFQYKNNKTTDINILLNRVRLDRKKTIKKKVSAFLISLLILSFIIAFIII